MKFSLNKPRISFTNYKDTVRELDVDKISKNVFGQQGLSSSCTRLNCINAEEINGVNLTPFCAIETATYLTERKNFCLYVDRSSFPVFNKNRDR
jgi:hypothetical protein